MDAAKLTVSTISQLAPEQVATIPIVEANLICAQGLAETPIDISACVKIVPSWAERVRSETIRHQYRFDRNPAEFENSKGFFQMLMMAVVLAEDFNIKYDPQRSAGPESSRIDDGFFSKPELVFLNGLLGPERAGTCSSLPVLYVAIGRELGYPLKLVTTKGHLFVRWEGQGERFNVEATSHGLNRFDDDYYRQWPFTISEAEEEAEGYLKSLTPSEELAVFLSIRGMCLREQGRTSEAAQAFGMAVKFAPHVQGYRSVLGSLESILVRKVSDTTVNSQITKNNL